jgi:hypothetical protein
MMTNEEAIEEIYNLMGLVTALEFKHKLPREITLDITNTYRTAVGMAVQALKKNVKKTMPPEISREECKVRGLEPMLKEKDCGS